jgi:uncharacterized membrane protein YjjB (DUF3815 family)
MAERSLTGGLNRSRNLRSKSIGRKALAMVMRVRASAYGSRLAGVSPASWAARSWLASPAATTFPAENFFALTVGAVAPRGLTALAGNPQVQGFNDIRDATSESVALTLGLIAGAGAAAAIAACRRRSGRVRPAEPWPTQ